MLERARSTLNRRPNHVGGVSQMFEHPDRDRKLELDRTTWQEMGEPDVITVTIEPGDLLND